MGLLNFLNTDASRLGFLTAAGSSAMPMSFGQRCARWVASLSASANPTAGFGIVSGGGTGQMRAFNEALAESIKDNK